MSIINVDLDGVVDNFHMMFDIHYHTDLRNTPVWDAWEYLGISRGQFNSMIRKGVEAKRIWHEDPVIEGARECLWRLSDDGHFIRIVTTRLVHKFNHALIVKATADWLDKNDIPYRSIAFLGPGESKADYKADYAIDDSATNCFEMLDAGIDAVTFSRPWNQGFHGLLYLNTWQEFYDYISC